MIAVVDTAAQMDVKVGTATTAGMAGTFVEKYLASRTGEANGGGKACDPGPNNVYLGHNGLKKSVAYQNPKFRGFGNFDRLFQVFPTAFHERTENPAVDEHH